MTGPYARDRIDEQIAAWDDCETRADDDRLHGHDTECRIKADKERAAEEHL